MANKKLIGAAAGVAALLGGGLYMANKETPKTDAPKTEVIVPAMDAQKVAGVNNIPSTAYVTSFAELKAAIKSNDSLGNPRVVYAANGFTWNDSIAIMPKSRRHLVFDGVWQDFPVDNATGCAAYRNSKDLNEANTLVDGAIEILHCNFIDMNLQRGKPAKGTCLRFSSSYGINIHDNWFSGFEVATRFDFCLQNRFNYNRLWETSQYGLINSWKGIPGGGPSTSQGNASWAEGNVFRMAYGSVAAILDEGSSGCVRIHNIVEGGNAAHQGGKYSFYFDDSGSPNVKGCYYAFNHIEVINTAARFYCRLNAGNAVFDRNYFQYTGIDVESNSQGYANFHILYPDYIPPGTQYRNGGGCWEFVGLEWPFDPYAAATWYGGSIPSCIKLSRTGNGADRIPYDVTRPAWSINGKNY